MTGPPERFPRFRLADAYRAVKRFQRRVAEAAVGKHVYYMGLQHRRTGESVDGDKHWRPVKPSHIYFFQNDAGAKAHVVDDALEEEILENFDY